MAPGMVSTRRVGGVVGAAGAGTAAMRPVLLVPQYEPTPESLFFLWDGGTWAWVKKWVLIVIPFVCAGPPLVGI